MNETTGSQKCGYIAIIGRPNVGKSTLVNSLIGQKISITSPKPQTTRSQVLGIKTLGNVQALYIDTPGLHTTEKHAINRYMNKLASSVMSDANVIVFMIEALRWTEEDAKVLSKIKQEKTPVILVINKIDNLRDKKQLLPFIKDMQEKHEFAQIIPISATHADNVNRLEQAIMEYLPVGPFLFPDDQVTDKGLRFQVAEIIREKLIKATEQEVPYSSTVTVDDVEEGDKIIKINATIWVEREGQKAIVIGKGGEQLKSIGTQARKEIEFLLNSKVFLRLWVKVKERWTDSDSALKNLGYE